MNIQIAQTLLTRLSAIGVRDFCVCAGARNSPLVMLLDKAKDVQLFHFFDERSAGFFSIGRMHAIGKPVAVVTTSGTAVAELLPSVVESHYQGLPLIVISADRPKNFRNTGAPQTIEQVGIFSTYVEKIFDLDELSFQRGHSAEALDFGKWSGRRPLHLNICFAEPLIDDELPILEFSGKEWETPDLTFASGLPVNLESPLVIVGSLPEMARAAVVSALERLGAPVHAETISGIRGEARLQNLLLNSAEKSIAGAFEKGVCKSVLRIGGVPTLRFWRDLEDRFKDIPVYSVSEQNFSGLSRPCDHRIGFSSLETFSASGANLSELDQHFSEKQSQLLQSFPLSEPAMFEKLSQKLANQSVYLGNSLPIREWDLAASSSLPLSRVLANRGANGIDGQISTFLGWAGPQNENWAVVGDLTTLYDLSSLWITPQLQQSKLRIVVVNNFGGQIFKNVFGKEIFLNRHQISFEAWAKMWGWDYQCWHDVPQDVSKLSDRVIIELRPLEEQSNAFWKAYREL